jgi:hypothetical protein
MEVNTSWGGRFKGNNEEDEWLRLALCSLHQTYQKKNKTCGFG